MKECVKHKDKVVGKCSKGFPCILLGECVYGHELIKDNEDAKFIIRVTKSVNQTVKVFHKVASGKPFTGIAKHVLNKYKKRA